MSDSSPPTMIASVPSRAFATAPETGASTMAMPLAASMRASLRVVAGSEELMSTTTAPRFRPGRAAVTASATALPSGTMVISTSAPAAASRADARLPGFALSQV